MSSTVSHCKNCQRFRSEGVSFHQFPKDRELLKKWLIVVKKDDSFKLTKYKLVSSDHFTTTDFIVVN
ncbi:hypothetical protein Zmor_011044 [Zophobas morio]|uniref:THAP-type domain-containing protein n=1 Tax=Zophobas morio TaxID=2755281 RepID=A0AA38IUA2_9CUCU|nr:hypothetical protein Zmor_011044 [Zophobas morio]